MHYQQRQNALIQQLPPRSAALFVNPPAAHKSADEDFPHRPDSHMLYICGLREEEAAFILLSEDLGAKRIAFVKERDPAMERWVGASLGLDGAKALVGADAVYALPSFAEKLDEILLPLDTLYFDFTRHAQLGATIHQSIARLRRRGRRASEGPRQLHDLHSVVAEMRRIKDAHEITQLAKAAEITARGFEDALSILRPEVGEWEIEAELFRGFRRRGAGGTSFASIVAGGNGATTLHYVDNDRVLKDGDLVLIDAGAQYEGYAGDISRTYPVNGQYTQAQRTVYELVLKALNAGIDAAVVGAPFTAPHEAVRKVFAQGLHDLGILKEAPQTIIDERLDFAYFMHGTSHFIGLDTHDCGTAYQRGDDAPVALQSGMLISVEPGLYFTKDDESVPAAYRGIGIRIEDDILITDEGPRNLTASLAKDVDAIEAFMREVKNA